ncbi:phosphatase PAP2 family protein [Brochothrix thermosphacta]|uniref:phosphatase PAP2 family protein n=1 Tax=Brochothrix thermosphacta TaxID=2756 RepID=UPI0006862718|nr:phosphatase PAP2 family protein [Brochothrix thermosphacta]ODJ50731.1 hypothetical protein BFR34_02520 [Brochothrix thermosphacta DSM 20171 = FSL F6-1036]
MLTKKQSVWRYVMAGLFFIVFLYVAAAVAANALWIQQFDQTIRTVAQTFQPDKLTGFIETVTDFAGVKGMITLTAIVAVILACYRRFLFAGWLAINMLFGASSINFIFKNLFQRDRPAGMLIEQGGYSFPSGHTMAITTFTLSLVFILTYNNRRYRRALLLLSALLIIFIGFTRVYLGVHYPSDILGGFMLSCCYMLVATTYFRQFSARIERKLETHGIKEAQHHKQENKP